MELRILASAIATLCAVGCNPSPAPAPPSPSSTPSAVTLETPSVSEWRPEVVAQAEQLLAGRKEGKFAPQDLNTKESGPAFVYLALTSDDPQIVGSALEGVEKTYNPSRETDSSNRSDSRVVEAILKGLNSSDGFVLHYALKAAPDALGQEPNTEVTAKLVEIGNTHPAIGARIEVLNALATATGYEKNPDIVALFIKALKDEPAVADTALFRRSFGFTKAEKAEEMKAAVDGLLSHEDPGVRGRAIEPAWDFHNRDNEWALMVVAPLVKDKNPFVRSKAAHVLGLTKDPRAVSHLMALLDDKSKNTYGSTYQNLLGRTETIHHDGSAWSRVDDAALYALNNITRNLPESDRFEYERIDYKNVEGDISAQVAKAKTWYQTFRKTPSTSPEKQSL